MSNPDAPYKSALFIIKAVNLSCPSGTNCIFCEYHDFCSALANAYVEAVKILPKEVIDEEFGKRKPNE